MENLIYTYQGNEITFQNSGNVMVNATQMAKAFGNSKRPQFWINTQQSKDYIDALSEARNIATADLVQVKQGGNPQLQGTWMHQDVALEFARWLSPAFAIWTNDRIRELLTTGVATTSDDDEMIAQAMTILQKRLEASSQRVQMLESENEIQHEQIRQLAPRAEYAEKVLQSASTFTTGQVGQGIGMSAVTLNRQLYFAGVQYRQSGQWMLYARHRDSGLTEIRITKYINSHTGEIETRQAMVWTEKGRRFIHQLHESGKL